MLSYFLPLTTYPYQGRVIDCPVCGSSNHERILNLDRKIKRLPTHLCGDCGLFFTNPMPTDDELAAYYANVYRAEYQLAFLRPRKTHQNKKRREALRRAERLASMVDLSEPLRTLDFGCGSGEFVRHLATLGHHAHGFEPGETYSAHAADNAAAGDVRTGTWRDMTYPPESFDVITCLHVLEHLNAPAHALAQIREWLAPSGILYLEVPNMQGYELKGFERFHFAHVLGFSRANLMYAAEKAGFGLLREDTPTSLFLVRDDDPRAARFEYDLPATAARNRIDYSAAVSPTAYLDHHVKRIGRMIKTEIRQGR
ncbi:MAG: class I SAM-dependent methyltransferase [Pseudomonadota bacterium]